MTTIADPSTTALVIMDYQPATLGFLADSDAFVATAQSAADALRAAGGTVVFVRVAFTDADYAQFPSRSVMGQRVTGNRPGLDADSPTSALHRALAVADGDLVVRKTRVGSFSTTKLNAALTDSGIDTLLLVGVHTSGAVLTTVREAHDLDYDVTVLAANTGLLQGRVYQDNDYDGTYNPAVDTPLAAIGVTIVPVGLLGLAVWSCRRPRCRCLCRSLPRRPIPTTTRRERIRCSKGCGPAHTSYRVPSCPCPACACSSFR